MSDDLMRFPSAVRRAPAVEAWFASSSDGLKLIARAWFGRMRGCGKDVRELFHDGGAVACVEDAAFGYVHIFKAHINVGFFNGSVLDDPAGLLEGSGKRMRHVKLRPGVAIDEEALAALIAASYRDMRGRVGG